MWRLYHACKHTHPTAHCRHRAHLSHKKLPFSFHLRINPSPLRHSVKCDENEFSPFEFNYRLLSVLYSSQTKMCSDRPSTPFERTMTANYFVIRQPTETCEWIRYVDGTCKIHTMKYSIFIQFVDVGVHWICGKLMALQSDDGGNERDVFVWQWPSN